MALTRFEQAAYGDHAVLDPLLHPPLSLAIVACALKYVTTVVVLGEPLFLTRIDYLARRDKTSVESTNKHMYIFFARLLFVFFTLVNLIEDISTISKGLPALDPWQRLHFIVVVLAFSPNTAAALAGVFIINVKINWIGRLPLRSGGFGMLSDMLVLFYAMFTAVAYLIPLAILSFPYAFLGGSCLMLAVTWDVVMFPVRWYAGDLHENWIALPVFVALGVLHTLIAGLIFAQVFIVERRYPDLAERTLTEGTRSSSIEVMMPHKITAHVIGCARDLANGKGKKLPDAELVDMDCGQEDLLEAEDTDGASETGTVACRAKVGQKGRLERCILNDDSLAALCYVKITLCVSTPIFQVCVLIAARIMLQEYGFMEAIDHTFAERTWREYFQGVSHRGLRGFLPLLWFYV